MKKRTLKHKVANKLLKKTQTPEEIQKGSTCRFLSGQVVLFEAGSLFGAKWRCKFFILENVVGEESTLARSRLAVALRPKRRFGKKTPVPRFANQIKMIFLQLFLFTFTALSVGACFSMHQPSHNFHFHEKGEASPFFFVGNQSAREGKSLKSWGLSNSQTQKTNKTE